MKSEIRYLLLPTLAGVILFCQHVVCEEPAALRTNRGLVVLYDFTDTALDVVRDQSGVGSPINLTTENVDQVRRTAGSMEMRGNTLIRSSQPASRVIESIRRTGEMSVEAWIRPNNINQKGPARIITLSRNSTQRNFTLGQDGDKLDVRLRTTSTSGNGLPSLSSKKTLMPEQLVHVVYTRSRSGKARLYVNGEENASRSISGSTSNWDPSFRLALANEQDKNRPWKGRYYLVALFDRKLSRQEVEQNFRAGVNAKTERALATGKTDGRAEHFETKIAPLIASHCLECHDSAIRKGGLDLSKKVSALKGGENGKALTPKKPAESLIWAMVDSDDMPAERPPLSAAQKELLRKWIDDGAVWTIEKIDPAVYAHSGRQHENFLRRLTIPEYIETVRSSVGVDIAKEAREILPPDLRADGFSNTAYNLTVDLKHVEAYAKLAALIVGRMDVKSFANGFSRNVKFTDKDMGTLISKMGKWILRGPVEEHEIITYRGISTTVASAGGSYEEAVSYIIEAMLQSPRFIYRIENQSGDGSTLPVNEYELASRLSYILWGGPPDRQLIKAAEDGELFDGEGVEKQVGRMLADPRAIEQSLRFISEWLNLGRLDNMQPNRKKFANWDPNLAGDMRDETLTFFREVVWIQKRPLSDLLNAQVSFATPRLANHYGLKLDGQPIAETIEPVDDTSNSENRMQRYDLTSVSSRGGLLTQGSVLTVGGDGASTVTRGLFVMHELLRGVVKDPPPCVDTTPIPTKAGVTNRSIAMQRIANSNCGGCHAKFEPLAFGLEKFDGLGTYHERDEHGNELRDDGDILFPGDAKPVGYKSSAELMNLLAESDRVRESITWKLTQFALGRPLAAADASSVANIHKTAQENGGTYASLMKAIVTSDLVKSIRTESAE